MAGDVLRGNAAGALGESGFVAGLLAGGEFAFGVSVEISAIAVEGEHEEEFGVQARGRDMVGGEAGDGGGEGRLQLHLSISTQIYFNAVDAAVTEWWWKFPARAVGMPAYMGSLALRGMTGPGKV
jgi:hypothetical protein